MSETSNNAAENRGWLSEGLLIAACSLAGYLLTFSYEAGYCDQFGIPWEMISPSPTTVFIASVAVVLYMFVGVVVPNILYLLPGKHPALLLTSWIGPPIGIIIVTFSLYHIWSVWALALLVANTVVAISFLLIQRRVQRAESENDEAALNRERERLKTIAGYIPAILMSRNTALVVVLVFGILLAYSTGTYSALQQKNFLVASNVPEVVVIRIYGERIICSAFDRKRRSLRPELYILKAGEDPKLRLRWEQLGILAYGRLR